MLFCIQKRIKISIFVVAMKEITPRKVTSNINAGDYVNVETGELLISEVKDGVTLTVKEGTTQFMINSDKYVTFDTNAILFLASTVGNADIGKIVQIANLVKGECSVVYNGNYPHTSESLAVTLDMNLNKFYAFVRKMVKSGVMAYIVCAPSGYVQKVYMLNPFIARRSKFFHVSVQQTFKKLW